MVFFIESNVMNEVLDDYIESPVMPPKKEFSVTLIVKSIERGRPSICDDLEMVVE